MLRANIVSNQTLNISEDGTGPLCLLLIRNSLEAILLKLPHRNMSVDGSAIVKRDLESTLEMAVHIVSKDSICHPSYFRRSFR